MERRFMSADRRVAAFLTLADEELDAAKMLAGGASRQAAYFIQQAAEKAARALLTAAGIPFGTGHNLGLMAAALPVGHPLKQRIAGFDKYSSAATLYRYPSPAGRLPPLPDTAAINSDIADVEAFIAEVRVFLGRSA
jgi:HEPN domain-containing protein